MTKITNNWNPFLAWLKSLPLALGIPAVLWIFLVTGYTLVKSSGSSLVDGLFLATIFVLYSSVVHFIAYVITGIPAFFLLRYRSFAFVWKMPWGLFLGIFLSMTPVLFFVRSLTELTSLLGIMLLLGCYGLITALAAWLQRPQEEMRISGLNW